MARIGIFFQQLGKNVNKSTELMLFNYSKPAVFVNCLYICDALLIYKSGKTKCARFEKRNVQKLGKTKRSKNFAHTTL